MSSKNMPKATPQNKHTAKQYEDLGKIVASVYETGYLSAAKSYRMSFLKGLFQGAGGVIGATVLIALLIWVLSLFSEIPLLNRIAENLQQTVQTTQQK